MEKSGSVIWSLYLLGIFYIGYVAGYLDEKYPDTISCYQCNSEYDPRCGDPFDPYSLGTVNCSLKRPLEHLPHLRPVLCRKTVQKVQGHTRVIRGCGYVTDERDDKTCIRRTGTHEVLIHYCSCTKDLCNAGHTPTINFFSILSVVILGCFNYFLLE